MSPGVSFPAPTSTSVPDDRAHHLPAERGRADVVAQHAVADVDPARLEHPPDRGRALRPLRQNAAKSCSPTNGSAPSAQQRAGRAARAPTTRSGRGTGRASAGSRPCSGTRRHVRGAPGVEAGVDELGVAHHDLGPELRVDRALHAARGRRRRRPGSDTTWPHACTPASVRPAHDERRRRARSDARERARRARPRRCAGRGCAAKPWNSVPSYATVSFSTPARVAGSCVAGDHRARAGSHQFDARHGRVVTGARAELQDPQVAAVRSA